MGHIYPDCLIEGTARLLLLGELKCFYLFQLAHEVRDTVGPLTKIKDRRYGRTWLAVYAAA